MFEHVYSNYKYSFLLFVINAIHYGIKCESLNVFNNKQAQHFF